MKTHVQKTAEFGDFVLAAFDGAACYSNDPLVVARLAAGAVSLMLRHTRTQATLPLQRQRETKAVNLLQLAVTERRENWMENTQAQVGKMETRLKQWGARLDQIVAKTEKAGAQVSVERRKCVDELKAKYQAAQSRFGELKAAGSEKWDTFTTGVETAWSDLEAAFNVDFAYPVIGRSVAARAGAPECMRG
jgi:hypothetical protein